MEILKDIASSQKASQKDIASSQKDIASSQNVSEMAVLKKIENKL